MPNLSIILHDSRRTIRWNYIITSSVLHFQYHSTKKNFQISMILMILNVISVKRKMLIHSVRIARNSIVKDAREDTRNQKHQSPTRSYLWMMDGNSSLVLQKHRRQHLQQDQHIASYIHIKISIYFVTKIKSSFAWNVPLNFILDTPSKIGEDGG